MRHFFLLIMTLTSIFIHSSAGAQTSTGDDILGKWTNEDKTRVLEFVKAGDVYEAVIKEAPDKELVGKKQITNLQLKGSSYSGKVYLPKRGKTLPCTITLNGNNSMRLSARSGIMSQSQNWTRVQ